MILFRCNAGPQIGFGHLTRCRALAFALQVQGASCMMVGPDHAYVNEEDSSVFDAWLPQVWDNAESDALQLVKLAERYGAKKLVLDDYRVNEAYQLVLRNKGLKWLQFEARTSQPIWADIVLSASPSAKKEDYGHILHNPDTQLLLGPKFAVLRPEFANIKPRNPEHPIKKVLVTFGGGDDRGAIHFVLSTLLSITSSDLTFLVISGEHNPRNAEYLEWIKKHGEERVNFLVNPRPIAPLFMECDLAVMAGGTMTFEAACCGLPMLLITIADNQVQQATAWEELGQPFTWGVWLMSLALNYLKPFTWGVWLMSLALNYLKPFI